MEGGGEGNKERRWDGGGATIMTANTVMGEVRVGTCFDSWGLSFPSYFKSNFNPAILSTSS